MDYWSYLPFLQFIRDDKETVTIMAEAMRIVPNVCKILHLSRSTGRNNVQPNGDTAAASTNEDNQPMEPSSLPSTSSPQPLPAAPGTGTDNLSFDLQDLAAASSLVTMARQLSKRPGEASSSPAIMYPLKKRRLMQSHGTDDNTRDPNQPSTSASARIADMGTNNRTPTLESIISTSGGDYADEDHLTILRLKLKQDYDTFVDQVGQLASLERQKNTLIQKFVQLCTEASLSSAPTEIQASEAADTNPPIAGTSSAAMTNPSLEAVNGSNADIENDHPYASSSPPSTSS